MSEPTHPIQSQPDASKRENAIELDKETLKDLTPDEKTTDQVRAGMSMYACKPTA